METILRVTGMTCGGCARHVRDAVGALAGVSDVSVNLTEGAVRVESDRALDMETVERALEAAGGYRLVRTPSLQQVVTCGPSCCGGK
jgi:copper chaperone CopZ